MRTLIAEDDFTSRRILTRILSKFGECDAACNGREALEAFEAAHGESLPYDCVILDMNMPEVPGEGVLSAIRKWEAEHRIYGLDRAKVVIATVRKGKDAILSSFGSECDGYIIKPYSREQILGTLAQAGAIAAPQPPKS